MQPNRGLSRRGLLAWAAAAGSSRALANEGRRLRVLTWPGYADADVVQAFEARHKVRVEVTYVDSDDTLWQRVTRRNGRDFDVFAVNTAELQRYIGAGLVMPLDPNAITRRDQQLPAFREWHKVPGLVHGGSVYGVPYTYAEMGLIYDLRQWREPPDSLQALWSPAQQGKVLAYNGGVHAFSLAGLSLGASQPFQIRPGEWGRLVDRLVALRRNVAAFYTQPDESVRLFKSRGASLMFANYGSQQVALLKAAGLDVGYTVPREGALAWLDCWALTAGCSDPALAASWMDYLLEPGPSEVLLSRQGLANTRSPSPFHQADARLWWLEPVEDPDRRNAMWRRIVSGDRPARVMAA